MTHSAAREGKLTERYLLSELGEAEREEFELHFFSCPECTGNLKDGAAFLDVAKDMVSPFAPPLRQTTPRQSWFSRWLPQPFPAFAALSAVLVALCGLTLYEAVQNRSARSELAYYQAPRQAPEQIYTGGQRGSSERSSADDKSREFEFVIDVNSDESFASYRCDISGAGIQSSSLPVKAGKPGLPVHIVVPRHDPAKPVRIDLFGISPEGKVSKLNTIEEKY